MADNSISEKIEEGISGVLRFTARFSRTIAALTIRSGGFFAALDRLLREKHIVAPLTFVVIGAYLFSVLLNVFPAGPAAYINVIWFADDIATMINDRGPAFFSISNIIFSGTPMFLTVVALASIYRWCLFRGRSTSQREFIFITTLYAFGYHLALVGGTFVTLVFMGTALELFLDASDDSSLFVYAVDEAFFYVFISGIILGFVVPIILLTRARLRVIGTFNALAFLTSFLCAVSIATVALFVTSFIGSLPGSFTHTVGGYSAPIVETRWIDDWVLKGGQLKDRYVLERHILFESRSDETLFVDLGYSKLEASLEVDDQTVPVEFVLVAACNEAGRMLPFITLLKGETIIKLSFPIEPDSWRSMRENILADASIFAADYTVSEMQFIGTMHTNFDHGGSFSFERENHSSLKVRIHPKRGIILPLNPTCSIPEGR